VSDPGTSDFALGMLRGGHLATHISLFRKISRQTLDWIEEPA
jgi:hypothetical protein